MDARQGGYSDLNFWCRNGGMATLQSFETESPRDIPVFYTDFVDNLPYYHEDDLRVFVHAGINPNQPDMTKQDRHLMIWIRDEFLNLQQPFFKYAVHGHTPQVSGKPDVRRNRANLDTYCFASGILTCAVFDNEKPEPFEVLQAGPNGDVVRFSVNR
jgi:serine/threonine protein phosphatase 1